MFETVRKGEIESVKRIEKRIGLDIQFLIDGNTKQNANFAAMKIQDEAKAMKMVQWLVGKGCQIKLTDDLDQTCLYYAARDGKTQLVRCLIELGVDINHVDTYGQTAFFYSCREGHIDICKLMIERGVDVNHVDNEEVTPLFYAVRSGFLPVVKLLVSSGAKINHMDVRGVTAYQLAKMTNAGREVCEFLLKSGATKTLVDEPVPKPKPKKMTQKEMRAEARAARLAKEEANKRLKIQHQSPT